MTRFEGSDASPNAGDGSAETGALTRPGADEAALKAAEEGAAAESVSDARAGSNWAGVSFAEGERSPAEEIAEGSKDSREEPERIADAIGSGVDPARLDGVTEPRNPLCERVIEVGRNSV